jgi:hypothetical protein
MHDLRRVLYEHSINIFLVMADIILKINGLTKLFYPAILKTPQILQLFIIKPGKPILSVYITWIL